jgi:hypothetical protein
MLYPLGLMAFGVLFARLLLSAFTCSLLLLQQLHFLVLRNGHTFLEGLKETFSNQICDT